MARVSPKSLLLDLLRVSPPMPVRRLIEVGALFELEANAIRVALTRLVRRGLVVKGERGTYRMAQGAAPVSRWIDDWRRGDRRLKRWTGSWLCVWHPRGGGRGARGLSHRALARLGFREGRSDLWVRPDNLRRRSPEVASDLVGLGLARGAVLFVGHDLPAEVAAGWSASLWRGRPVADRHRRSLRAIERSRSRLSRLSRDRAMVESFLIGGEAIRSLAG